MAKISFRDPLKKVNPTNDNDNSNAIPEAKDSNQATMDSLAVIVQTEGQKGMATDTAIDIAKVIVVIGLLYLIKRKWRPLPKSITRWKPKVVIPDSKARKILREGGKKLGWVGKIFLVADLLDAGSDLIKVMDRENAIQFAESHPILDIVPWSMSASNKTYAIDPDLAKAIALSMMVGATKHQAEKQFNMAAPFWTEAHNLMSNALTADIEGHEVLISWPEGFEADRQTLIDAWLGWYKDVEDSDLIIDVATMLYNPSRVLTALPKLKDILKNIIYIM